MNPVLFEPGATVFTTNGVGRLSDALSCVVTEERNGIFELEMQYPATGKHATDIVHSSIIYAKPSARRGAQAFRVYKITKPLNGRITVKAQHISYQLSYIPVSPFTADTLAHALQFFKTMAAENCPFTLSADFDSEVDFSVPIPTSIRGYLGGRRGSILDIYGGEWEWNNYQCILHRVRGQNNGYTIRYGKNLTDIKQEESIESTYTGIFPYWKSDEVTVTLPEKVIHAPTAQNFPYQRTVIKDFTQNFPGAPTVAQLRQYTQQFINANGIGVPNVNLSVDFVHLGTNTNIDLCDTVKVYFEKLNVAVESKVIATKWNVLKDRYDSIEIGNRRTSLATTIEEQIETVTYLPTAEEMTQSIDRATGVLNAGRRGHVIINRNEEGFPSEILFLDNENIAQAVRVLRINENGIGFSSNGYQGDFKQAWLLDGTLSLGGVNNGFGNLIIRASDGTVIGRWNNEGIYANGGSLRIGDKFRVDTDGNLHAVDGSFTGNINSGSVITGAKILASEIGTKNDEFYVVENGERVEIGFSGFDVWDNRLRTNWIGAVTNPATGGSDAGINGNSGDAGFRRLFLLDDWYEGEDGSMWDVTRTIRWIDNRLKSIENFCAHHDWGGDDDETDPGTPYNNGDNMSGNGTVGDDVNQPSDPIGFDSP